MKSVAEIRPQINADTLESEQGWDFIIFPRTHRDERDSLTGFTKFTRFSFACDVNITYCRNEYREKKIS